MRTQSLLDIQKLTPEEQQAAFVHTCLDFIHESICIDKTDCIKHLHDVYDADGYQIADESAAEYAELALKQESASLAASLAYQPQLVAATAEPTTAEAPVPAYEGFYTVAMRAIERGQRPLPIRAGAKNPLIKWKGSSIDTSTKDEWPLIAEEWVRTHAEKFPDASVCVIAKPDEFLFLDEDESNRFRNGYEELSGAPFPRTFTTESREDHRQSHWLQTDATRALGNQAQPNLGFLSVRENNLYVLSEGSQHPKGGFYRIVDDTRAVPMPDKMVEYIQKLKADKLAAERSAEQKPADLPSTTGELDATDRPSQQPDPVVSSTGTINEGSRNSTLTSLAGYAREKARMEIPELKEYLRIENRERCSPPLPDAELDTICESIGKKPIKEELLIHNGKPDTRQADYLKRKLLRLEDPAGQASPESMPEGLGVTNAQMQEKMAAVQGELEITDAMIDANFPGYDGQEVKQVPVLIEGFLPKGNNFIGSLSGVGKTWFGLSITKALTTGQPLLGKFPVKRIVPVLYLIPEASDASFKYRLRLMRCTMDKNLFRYRTISQGRTLKLTDPLTLAAIKKLHSDGKYPDVLVIVDTAIRFMTGKDENAAGQNNLVQEADILRSPEIGADLLFMHHSPKASIREEMTLENVLRGSGDFGAMADSVYGIRRDEGVYNHGDGPEEMDVVCCKPRDIEPPSPFRVRLHRQAKPGENDGRPVSVIEETGDIVLISQDSMRTSTAEKLDRILRADPLISTRALQDEMKMRWKALVELASQRGWQRRHIANGLTGGKKTVTAWSQISIGPAVGPVTTDREDVISFDSEKWARQTA